ncbi:magnesium-translocating P-type ATPase [Ferrovum myxofaciens]|uniref:Magnesium-transporting ATPase, P-type 1 n=3 Tax=root TaxID=1 RepID=A0A9E6MW40_9PROT|nr:magnesium-translocating P-type ATPase [Ferrovum myxofaciens]QKE39255.1 MAG: magnesium-translocating P-type ATPase [Ferrovum myxofaciens]QWY74513.1 MAG: magnesium-translocating P-type ATPase [Ferrovum myxofaciens]QWY77264.1 MAG: magnesium-translocating P-type ATPase [Ferrovum myxofaciens]
MADFRGIFFKRNISPRSSAPPGQSDSTLLLEVAHCESELALRRLDSSVEGLLDREAEDRLGVYGANTVAQEARVGPLRQLLSYFKNPLNLLLIALAVLSLYLGDREAATIIALMVVISITLTFVQEYRSTNAAERLREMVSTTATVLRKDRRSGVPDEVNRYFNIHLHPHGPQRREVPIAELVPGDVIQLSAGDMIPADVRLLTAKDLFINQSSLTGEALPVEKFFAAETDTTRAPLQLNNVCFMGTNVVSGTATAVIVHTGALTYFGRLAQLVTGEKNLTSFDRGIRQFTWLMIRFIFVMTPLVFLINGFTKGDWMEAFLFAVAVAVGLTPEMLPMIVTVNLGKGALAMSRKKVIVKRLNSIQNFGAMDVLCTDKTGTLTQDKIILEKHVDIYGHENEDVLEYAYLNSYHQSGLKNLLDVAVLEYAGLTERIKAGVQYRKIDEIPFDFQRRRMSVVVEGKGRHLLICKGAVEEVFSCCTHAEVNGSVEALEPSYLGQLLQVTRELNEDGFRVIAIAYKETASRGGAYGLKDESDLVLVGYIAFLDPPKDSAREAIAALHRHGVQVKILTGDNDVVTRKVCHEVGLKVDEILLGSVMETLSDEELAEAAERIVVFAKLSPAQKARVIKALHLRGHVVGFMGDGINDGPALKAADVGISVDTAVDIAKESADIILLEKSLMVLEEGVIEGRKVFGNIVKYIKMGASSNFGNMFSVLGASAWLPFLPMQAIQVLTNNLLYDFSQTAIPTDHVDEEYISQPRRWDIANITRFMLMMGPISSIFDYLTFALMYYVFKANTVAGESMFQTAWFVESLLSQTLIIHIIRTGRIPFLQSRASLPMTLTSLIICSVAVWLPYSPFAHALGFTPLPIHFWPYLVGILAGYLTLAHVVKTWFIRRYGLN